MRKIINLFVLPLFAGCIVCAALHTFIPVIGAENIDMIGNNRDFVFGFMGFVFGFLPCFIYGYAKYVLSGMVEPVECQDMPVLSPVQVFVGQTFTSVGSNCVLRVKALKVHTIDFSALNDNDNDYNFLFVSAFYTC